LKINIYLNIPDILILVGMSSAQSSSESFTSPAALATLAATIKRELRELRGLRMMMEIEMGKNNPSSNGVHVRGPRTRLILSPKKPKQSTPAKVSSTPVRVGSPFKHSPLPQYSWKKVVVQLSFEPTELFPKKK
jgi:hypothetical protein